MNRLFWLLLVSFTIIWYLVVTALVAYRGASDIRKMLGEFKKEKHIADSQKL
jgi:hypothetical protein